jgi:hypothetical protein
MMRRTNTTCAVQKELACKMFFTISWDRAGFFFSVGNGCTDHNNHIQLNQNETRFPTRLVESLERNVIENCGKANALNSTGRNVHFIRTGALLSSNQVHYINKLGSKVANALAVDNEEFEQDRDNLSGPDKLLDYFSKKQIGYCCLYNTQQEPTAVELTTAVESMTREEPQSTVSESTMIAESESTPKIYDYSASRHFIINFTYLKSGVQ